MRLLSCSLRALFLILTVYGIANAQITGGNQPLTCSVTTGVLPTLRAESLTDLIADIVITCTGGSLSSGQVDLTVMLPAPVTSRMLNGGASEALLLLDEPNSGLSSPVPGYGPAEPFNICSTPLVGCAAYPQQAVGSDNQVYQVAVNAPGASPTPGNAAPNVYQGVVSGNQVTFHGVPVVQPGPNGARILRITNVRMDATQISGASPVQASILVSSFALLPLSNNLPLVAIAQSSLTASAFPRALAACSSQTLQQATVLSFSEGFPTAFKTRVDPTIAGQASGQSASLVQNVPGTPYASESKFTLAIPGSSTPAGLAAFGTRFKAVFQNVPSGVRLFVSQTNITVDGTTGLATGPVAQPAANDVTHSFAQLMTGESTPYAVAGSSAQTVSNINLVEITASQGSSTVTAVWEVVNDQTSALDTFQFGVFVSYTPAPAGIGTVNLSYAPASGSGTVPQFAVPSSPGPAIVISSCGSLTLTASPNPAVYGQPVTLTATMSGGAGSVSFFKEPAVPIGGPAVLSGGTSQTTISLPAGTTGVYATLGSSTSNHVSLVVNKASTVTVLTSPDHVTATATVTPVPPGAGGPTGTVEFLIGQAEPGQTEIDAGLTPGQGASMASINTLVAAGSTAVYAGDANFNASVSAPVVLSPSPGGFTCSTNTNSTPTLRAESLTEEIGDIVLTCANGVSLAPGQPIPQVNVTVTLPAPITSRLLNGNVSEALLTIDEPNSGIPVAVPGFGAGEPFTLCSTPLAGCAAWAQQATVGGTTYEVAVNRPNASSDPANAVPNAYQGVVNGDSVTFYGVPVLPPGATALRVLRISNIRVNATQIDGSGSTRVQASILPSNGLNLPITSGTPIVGFKQASLATSAATPAQLAACTAQNLQQVTVLSYNELFGSALKTRVDPIVPGQTSGQSASLLQNKPGVVYSSESNFTYSVTGETTGGLADFGTRLKAVFKNVPTGVRLFVSLTNVTVDGSAGLVTGQAPNTSWPFAQLVTSETGPFTVATPVSQMAPNQVSVVEITPAAGTTTATAVWEVVTTNPNVIENFRFAVYVSYPASLSAAGAGTVNLSYGPTGASSTIPRFLDTSTSLPALSIASCQVTSSLTLTASPNPAVYGQPVTLTASAPTGATGGVIFDKAPSTPISSGAVALSNSKAQFSASFPVGGTNLLATYGGDLNFLPVASNQVALTVQKAATTTAITSALGRQPVTATVSVTAPGSGTPTGTVQFFNGSVLVGSVAFTQGQSVSLNTVAVPGMTAVYSGDSNFTGSTSPQVGTTAPRNLALTASPNPSILGQTVAFTLSMANTTSGGAAQFYDGTTFLGSASMNNGQATFSTSSLATGSHSIVASYLGDSASFGQVVNGLISTVTLTTGSSSPTFGQPVTLTAQLGPAPPAAGAAPSGQVEFRDGGFTIGAAAVSSGTASLALSTLAAGIHSFLAIYGGDRNWSAGHSSTLTLIVSAAPTTTTLIPSLTAPNQAVLTAVVAPSGLPAATPTGSVEFVDTTSKAVLATAALAQGRAAATFSAGQLITAAGVRSVAAVYSGDSDFGASTSTALFGLANAASFRNSAVAPDEIVTAFLPGLSGVVVSGAPANVVSSSSGQGSFVIPPGEPDGLIVVSMTDSTGAVLATLANVARTAPGLFGANASGQGVAAGYLVRVSADGAQTSEDIAKWDAASNSWAATPIRLGAATDHLFLTLFATGLRHSTNTNGVTATVNGVNAPVLYAGAQPAYPGVDQLNLQLPDGLDGAGSVKVVVTVDGENANPMTVTFE
jgi:hypothetical protein